MAFFNASNCSTHTHTRTKRMAVLTKRWEKEKKTVAVKSRWDGVDCVESSANGIGFRSNWCLVSWKLEQQVVALVAVVRLAWNNVKNKRSMFHECNGRSFAKEFHRTIVGYVRVQLFGFLIEVDIAFAHSHTTHIEGMLLCAWKIDATFVCGL